MAKTLGRSMARGANLGRLLCIAITGCAGCLSAFVVAIFLCPPVLALLSSFRHRPRDEPPFQWMEPMFWLLPVCALFGASAGGFLAWKKTRPGRLPNQGIGAGERPKRRSRPSAKDVGPISDPSHGEAAERDRCP